MWGEGILPRSEVKLPRWWIKLHWKVDKTPPAGVKEGMGGECDRRARGAGKEVVGANLPPQGGGGETMSRDLGRRGGTRT